MTINDLPDEILGQIFTTGLSGSSRDTQQYLCRISATNTHWRTVALNTPLLWTFILIDERVMDVSALSDWLRRSQECLLHVKIYVFGRLSYRNDLVGIMQSTSHRWLSLKVVIVPELHDEVGLEGILWTIFEDADGNSVTTFPNLHSVDFQGIPENQSIIDLDMFHEHRPLLGFTPALRHMSLSAICPGCPKFNFGTLTYLELSRFEQRYDEFVSLFALAPGLTTLVARRMSYDDSPFIEELDLSRRLSIDASSSKTLAVAFTSPNQRECFTEWISAPNLEYLEVASWDHRSIDLCSRFGIIPEDRLYENVRTLHLRDIDGSTVPTDFFFAFPNVEHLELVNTTSMIPLGPVERDRGTGFYPPGPNSFVGRFLWPKLTTITVAPGGLQWLQNSIAVYVDAFRRLLSVFITDEDIVRSDALGLDLRFTASGVLPKDKKVIGLTWDNNEFHSDDFIKVLNNGR